MPRSWTPLAGNWSSVADTRSMKRYAQPTEAISVGGPADFVQSHASGMCIELKAHEGVGGG